MSFKELIKNLENLRIEEENKQGFCYLIDKHYASIDAVETFNGQVKKRQVHWICEQRTHGYALILLNGVTGHEGWYIDKHFIETLSQETDCKFFTACLGCSRYPKLELDLSQMKEVVMQLHSQFN
ncbi:hypothetical protein [Crocosphaera chwakensis]|uniref:Uncharacterized protein n=1 Tax=Crocosphaera chwakensis CCY0110 TaxID=391612 RepID=A3ITU7_9CHRO|nr:hypothetical protein [Crocosphaera chwakensis]EAZ90042.1 hypothetical protein CY0110_14890 [Crocosphaera chwakensis CCY0110]